MIILKRVSILLLLVFLMIGFSISGVFAQVTHLTIGTASVTGTFYPLGVAASQIFNDNVAGIKAVAIATAGSAQDTQMLDSKEIEIAVIDSQECFWAYNAIDPYKKKQTNLRGLTGGLYTEGMQVLAQKDKGIDTMWDIKGKSIAVGAPGSGGQSDAKDLLKAHDMTFDDIRPVYLDAEGAVDMLKDGRIDVAILGLSEGSAAIAELMLSGKFKLLPVGEKGFQNYKGFYSDIIRFVIPANVYPNQDYEVLSVALPPRIFAVTDGMSEELAYNLCKSIYENMDTLKVVSAVMDQFNLERVATDVPLIPYHAGTLKYFKEMGITPLEYKPIQ